MGLLRGNIFISCILMGLLAESFREKWDHILNIIPPNFVGEEPKRKSV